MAKRLGRTRNSIAQRVFKLSGRVPLPALHKSGELAERVKNLCIPGVSDSTVADILGVTRTAIWRCRKRLGIPAQCMKHASKAHLSRSQKHAAELSTKAKVLFYYAGVGVSSRKIGIRIGVAASRVEAILKGFGLPSLGAQVALPPSEKAKPSISKVARDAAVIYLNKKGLSDRAISLELGLPYSTVYTIRRVYNLLPNFRSFT